MIVSGQLYAAAALSRGKQPLYPLDGRLDGHQIRSGHKGSEEQSSLPLPETEARSSGP